MQQQQWSILCRNFRAIGLELDIIAFKHECLLGVEVKYRKYFTEELYQLENICPLRKRQRLQKGLILFCNKNKIEAQHLRCDLALIFGPPAKAKIRYFPNING